MSDVRELVIKAGDDALNAITDGEEYEHQDFLAAARVALTLAREHVRDIEQKMIGHETTTGLTPAGQGYHAAAQNIGDYLDGLITKVGRK